MLVRFVEWLQGLAPELLWPMMLAVCFAAVLGLHRLFGEAGLYVYVVVAILGANVQVLKAVRFAVYPEPVALGTVLFSTSFLATDLLAERYGARSARTAVALGFSAYLLSTVLMILTIGFAPLDPAVEGPEMAWAVAHHEHISALFLPAPALFAAGMSAYLASQLYDVWFFDRLKKAFRGRYLWLRNNLSTLVSALIDNLIFSVLAWIVFAADPLPWKTVLLVYVLGTYWLRIVVALLDTPVLYLARKWGPS